MQPEKKYDAELETVYLYIERRWIIPRQPEIRNISELDEEDLARLRSKRLRSPNYFESHRSTSSTPISNEDKIQALRLISEIYFRIVAVKLSRSQESS
jgi:hypothetical protein